MNMTANASARQTHQIANLLLKRPALRTTLVLIHLDLGCDNLVAIVELDDSSDPTPSSLPASVLSMSIGRPRLIVESSIGAPDVREIQMRSRFFQLLVSEVPVVRAWLQEVYGDV